MAERIVNISSKIQELVDSSSIIKDSGFLVYEEDLFLLSPYKEKSDNLVYAKIVYINDKISSSEDESGKTFRENELLNLLFAHCKGKCSTYSEIFKTSLERMGILAKVTLPEIDEIEKSEMSELPKFSRSSIHRYLQVLEIDGVSVEDLDILVDPTIGQFIRGHFHIFVGTREDLRVLVKEAIQSGKIINTRFPEHIFIRAWGNKSR